MSMTEDVPAGLPVGSEIQQIAFVPSDVADHEGLVEFPHPIQLRAVRVDSPAPAGTKPQSGPPQSGPKLAAAVPVQLAVLVIPIDDPPSDDLLAKARRWVDPSFVDVSTQPGNVLGQPGVGPPSSLMTTLHGASIFWAPGRIAVLAPSDRLAAIRNAMIEISYFEGELREIERQLGSGWPMLEADIPHAFEFDSRSSMQRRQLRERFQQVVLLRVRLARITPFLLAPHTYPPTVASQVGERVRERARVELRHECVSDQLEVFEGVYEMCGQRSSDFTLTRSSNALEWTIIVLLLAQIVLSLFEVLTSIES